MIIYRVERGGNRAGSSQKAREYAPLALRGRCRGIVLDGKVPYLNRWRGGFYCSKVGVVMGPKGVLGNELGQ
jgi:hypothetical protein